MTNWKARLVLYPRWAKYRWNPAVNPHVRSQNRPTANTTASHVAGTKKTSRTAKCSARNGTKLTQVRNVSMTR